MGKKAHIECNTVQYTHQIILATKLIISVATSEIKVTKSKTRSTRYARLCSSWREKQARIAFAQHTLSRNPNRIRNKCKSCAYHLQANIHAKSRTTNKTTQQKSVGGKSASRATIVFDGQCSGTCFAMATTTIRRRRRPTDQSVVERILCVRK